MGVFQFIPAKGSATFVCLESVSEEKATHIHLPGLSGKLWTFDYLVNSGMKIAGAGMGQTEGNIIRTLWARVLLWHFSKDREPGDSLSTD